MNNALPDIFLLIIELLRYQWSFTRQIIPFFPPSREKGGKGKAEPLKPIFLLIFEWMKIKKVIQKYRFPPPPFPFEVGKK